MNQTITGKSMHPDLIEGMARRVDDMTAFLGMPLDPSWLELFQAGWLMTIEIDGGWRQTFKLRGTRQGIDALKLCASNYWSFDEAAPPNFVPDGELSASQEATPEGSSPEARPPNTTGTGFYVSPDAILLTNAHVVDGCREILVDGSLAALVSANPYFDSAILSVSGVESVPFAAFADTPAGLNSDIIVSGYPLLGLLGGVNITRGTVSSLKGLGGDETRMQISAPIQPGSSGGPVINESGEVVGVVVSKLDTLTAMEVIEDVPQNVNFAVQGAIAQLYMHQNGPAPVVGRSAELVGGQNLASLAVAFTMPIECIP